MSFILKGIDLPKGEKTLHMRVQSDGVVRYLIEGDDPVHIIDGAQAIQIPKDHGRLIDADRFIKSNDCLGWIEDMTVETFNKLTPTILEAEE